MKYSIRVKLISLILVAIVLPAMILGGTSIFYTEKLTDEYAHQNVSLICEKKAAEINTLFTSLEQSVDYMSINALEEISNPMNLMDAIYYENYEEKMRSILWNTSNNTDAAIAVYLRINPEVCGSYTAGMFLTREKLDAEMSVTEITDLSAYDESDTAHVGWYYQPIKAGEPIWMLPYYNQNIGVYMISYVSPLFKQDTTIGVLGMDINFNYITDQVDSIKVYNSGYAYITDSNGMVIHHPYLEYGKTVEIQKGWWYSKADLGNGMVLNITAPVSEINESRDNLIRNMFISCMILIFVFVIVTILITRKMTAPLQKLNQIANEIAKGNYDVDFDFERPSDEIGQLTTSFENTVATLNEYTTYLNGLAYKDSLTGVRNRMAYDYQVGVIEDDLKNGENTSIAVAVFDINNLKYINDTLGHEEGDILIKGACMLICQTFKHSAVFRIGGDEFVAIIKDTADEQIEEIFEQFQNRMEETWHKESPELRISIAYGYSRYDAAKDDKCIDPAFKRADAMMYDNKKAIKEKQKTV